MNMNMDTSANKMVVEDVQLCLLGGSATDNFNVAASSTAIVLYSILFV